LSSFFITNLTFGSYTAISSILNIVYLIIISPFIFHFWIIPKIEKRLSTKLEYKQIIYRWQVFAKWFVPGMDIGLFIAVCYLVWRISGKKKIKIWEKDIVNAHALAQTNYDIAVAPRFEIFISFLTVINLLNLSALMTVNIIKLYL
jgi:hypothetical protein